MTGKQSRSRLGEKGALGVILVVGLGWWLGGNWGLGSGGTSGTDDGVEGGVSEAIYRFDLVGDRIEHEGKSISLEELGRMAERARSEGASFLFQVKEGVRGLFVEQIQEIVSRSRVRALGLD